MTKTYTVDFIINDEDNETRDFRMVNTSTNRARSVLKKFVKIDANSNAIMREDVLDVFLGESKALNELMAQILIGNHDGIDWSDAQSAKTDEIISDFFTSFQ